jgi:hypothetical protein
MALPISLIITTLLLGLIIFLAYLFLNKLVNKPQQYSNQNIQNQSQENNNPNNNNNQEQQNNQEQLNNQNNQNIQNNDPPQNIPIEDNYIPPENNNINQNPDQFKKLTKKEQIKMLKKQEKAEHRENMRLMLEEKKRREQEKEKQLLLKEKMKEEEQKQLEEELKRVQEEQKKKEDEEYNKWKDMIKVGEEGEEKMDFTKEEIINKFLDYIKIRKVISLEDISGTFKLSPNEIVMKLNQFEKEGRIMGIIDDRGKYIYLTEKEMGLIEKMFINRGRISKADLIKECNRIIRFEPTEEDKVKIAEEQQKTLKELEEELNVKK